MPHISWFTRMPTRANPADSPSRGEAAHLNGDQRLLETTVCECTSRLMSAMLEKCNSGRGREEGERGGPREIPQCWMQKGCVDECTNETTTVTVDSVLLAVY